MEGLNPASESDPDDHVLLPNMLFSVFAIAPVLRVLCRCRLVVWCEVRNKKASLREDVARGFKNFAVSLGVTPTMNVDQLSINSGTITTIPVSSKIGVASSLALPPQYRPQYLPTMPTRMIASP